MGKIGIFAGTFDPVHAGHMEFADAATQAMGLDKVVFLPERRPRGKQKVTPLVHRQAMLELATCGVRNYELRTLPEPRFSVDTTLPYLKRAFLGEQLLLLLGSDVVRTLAKRPWPNLQQLLRDVGFVVGLRQGDEASEINELMEGLGAQSRVNVRFKVIASPVPHLSSSRLRHALGRSKDVSEMVSAYILAQNLYQ